MQVTPDALNLLGFTLDWNRLALLLGAVALLTLVGRRRDAVLDRAALWGLVAGLLGGRLASTLPSWGALQASGWERVRSVIDLRTGTLSLGWALGFGVLTMLLIARRRGPTLLPALLGAALIGVAPLLLKPAPTLRTVPGTLPLERYAAPGARGTPITFATLPGPTLVNVWASWCPPCRLEMPLLVDAARRGYPVTLVDSAEPPAAVSAYLQSVGFPGPYFRDSGPASSALQISGLPTTLLVAPDGRILERHFGPLSAAQLQSIFDRNGITPVAGGS
ncbi:thiol-disulfide isomerase/thioredoxin [Deinococcus metalli]|uniref:Thiol-disulfide isomerase/thioredoxin n=1 Tax=Deinococcus metalli TaxID=1141878 RepID=A0A7W8KJV1_9DEIO|nr:TlpA disulfide reductase family protein [Deinococcus metalli]MBB5378503.1 thiol-disulfide isomerase/thioredoxin [Deinococcus metalli]GHF58182.1 thiol:disulfide interchange protein [Deinococcus metalli]